MITKIKNQKSKIKNNEKGFTLIELLVSIVVVVAVGSVITGIVTSFLRGANKTGAIENIRQNGNYALSQMSKNIEYAQTFVGLSSDGETYTANCLPLPTGTPTPAYSYIKITSLNGSSIIYNCDGSDLTAIISSEPTPAPLPLIDTNSVSLIDCEFTCAQNLITDTPIIGVGFKLGPKNPSSLVENSAPPILFKTSITLRNYKK